MDGPPLEKCRKDCRKARMPGLESQDSRPSKLRRTTSFPGCHYKKTPPSARAYAGVDQQDKEMLVSIAVGCTSSHSEQSS